MNNNMKLIFNEAMSTRIWILQYRRILLYFLDVVLLRTANSMFSVAVDNIVDRLVLNPVEIQVKSGIQRSKPVGPGPSGSVLVQQNFKTWDRTRPGPRKIFKTLAVRGSLG